MNAGVGPDEVQIVFQDLYTSLDPRQTIRGMLAEVVTTHESEGGSDRVDRLLALVRLDRRQAGTGGTIRSRRASPVAGLPDRSHGYRLEVVDAKVLFEQVDHGRRHDLAHLRNHQFEVDAVVVTAVWPEQAFPANADIDRGIDFVVRMLQFVTPAPRLGLPAIAVPTGLHEGHPVGVQVQADRWRDRWCLDAAEAIESVCGALWPPEVAR